jgi:hypothetical protein
MATRLGRTLRSSIGGYEHERGSISEGLHEGGRVTHLVERQASRIQPNTFFNLAVLSIVTSAGLVVFGRRKEFANFVGLWAPSLLLIGIYNKLVQLEERETPITGRRAA